ncbi:hypothetical protein [Pigeonpox virus]|nr:hypothetical protein [Pigeonpox virus]
MGIKNLKSVLLLKHRLKVLDSAIKTKEMYVDFLGLFMAVAYSVTSTSMLHHIIKEKFKFIHSIADKVTVFVDRGSISLKTSLREKRKQSLKNQYKRKKEELKSLETAIENLSVDDEMYEEQKESLFSKIDKNSYYMFLADKKNMEAIIADVLTSLKNAEIYYCDHIDAEFMMCCKAREYYTNNGEWPSILSSDQDTICLVCVDMQEKILYDTKSVYRLSPNKHTSYLTKLIVLTNGCDFFKGLYGISINKDNYMKYELFTEFNRENVFKSIAHKNYNLNNNNTDENIDEISTNIDMVFDFISHYTSLNEDAYNFEDLPDIRVKDFLDVMVRSKWYEAKNKYDLGPDILQNIYNVYKVHRCNYGKEEETNILKMIESYKYRNIKINNITTFIKLLEIEISDSICTLGILPPSELYIGFEGRFYFNKTSIIKSSPKLINIDI